MANRKGLLIGSGQTGRWDRILNIWWEPENRPVLEQRGQNGALVQEGAGSRG